MRGRNRHELGAEHIDEAHHDTNQNVDARSSTLPPARHTDTDQCHDIDGKGIGGAGMGLQLKEPLTSRPFGLLPLDGFLQCRPAQRRHGL